MCYISITYFRNRFREEPQCKYIQQQVGTVVVHQLIHRSAHAKSFGGLEDAYVFIANVRIFIYFEWVELISQPDTNSTGGGINQKQHYDNRKTATKTTQAASNSSHLS